MKFLKFYGLWYLLWSVSVFAGDPIVCVNAKQPLGARYSVTAVQISGDKVNTSDEAVREFILWRNGKDVAHEYRDRKITVIWNQTPNGRLKALQAFDEHQRAIEYEPVSISAGSTIEAWERYSQMLGSEAIKAMRLTDDQGDGCTREHTYTENDNGIRRELVWLPDIKLARRFSTESKKRKVTWSLEELIQDKNRVIESIRQRQNYQTTDYADIGDNESDPFLLNMINLGFIAHGAGGFYDTEGNVIEAEHHHTH